MTAFLGVHHWAKVLFNWLISLMSRLIWRQWTSIKWKCDICYWVELNIRGKSTQSPVWDRRDPALASPDNVSKVTVAASYQCQIVRQSPASVNQTNLDTDIFQLSRTRHRDGVWLVGKISHSPSIYWLQYWETRIVNICNFKYFGGFWFQNTSSTSTSHIIFKIEDWATKKIPYLMIISN